MRYSTNTNHRESKSFMFLTRGLMMTEEETMSVNATEQRNNGESKSNNTHQRKATSVKVKENVTRGSKSVPSSEDRKHTGKRRMDDNFESRAALQEDDNRMRRSLSHDEQRSVEDCEESSRLSPLLTFARTSFVPRRELTDINRQGNNVNNGTISNSLHDLMMPFSQQKPQSTERENSSAVTHHFLHNTNNHNQSLLSTRNTTWEFASSESQSCPSNTRTTAMFSATNTAERFHLPLKLHAQPPALLPRSSREPNRCVWPVAEDCIPAQECSLSRSCNDPLESESTSEQEWTHRDQVICHSPNEAEENAASEHEMPMEHNLSPQETPKDCLEPNVFSGVPSQHQPTTDQVSACLAPKPSGICNAFGRLPSVMPFPHGPSQFQTPAQLQSIVPFSAWGRDPTKGPLANLSFPALGLADDSGETNDNLEMRDCDFLSVFGPRSSGTSCQQSSFFASTSNQEHHNLPYRREDAESSSLVSSPLLSNEGKQHMWSLDSAISGQGSSSLLRTP